MNRKNKIIYVGLGSTLIWVGSALAAPTGTVQSDYAKAVSEGQAQVKSDQVAATSQNEVKEGEIIEGDVDDGNVEVQETVEAGEAVESAEVSGEKSEAPGSSADGGGSESPGSSSSSSSSGGEN